MSKTLDPSLLGESVVWKWIIVLETSVTSQEDPPPPPWLGLGSLVVKMGGKVVVFPTLRELLQLVPVGTTISNLLNPQGSLVVGDVADERLGSTGFALD